MNADLNIRAHELVRHYKSLLTYSEINVEDNFVKINRTAIKLAIDYVKRKIEFLNSAFNHLSSANKYGDLMVAVSIIDAEKTNWKKILQILETENE